MPGERYDTLIIGAGMSGLAAGIRCAQFGQRVAVLDRHSLWGGLNSFYKLAGRRFDVGLHALTNYVDKGTRGRPLTRICRQLRIPWEALQLGQQLGSCVAWPDVRLAFNNDFELLRSEVYAKFPREAAGFDRLARDLAEYPDLPEGGAPRWSRPMLSEYLSDELLVDMLLLPLLYYGSPTPDDLEWQSFRVLWKSLYEEGFARPRGGVRTILDLLRGRLKETGGELRMRQGVARILSHAGSAVGVVLDDGQELRADRVLSSAGYVETMGLVDDATARSEAREEHAGQLTFVECLTVLDTKPAELGHTETIVFFNEPGRAAYDVPEGPVAYDSGVICCPDNYVGQDPTDEGLLRLTLRARYADWAELPEERYCALKDEVWETAHARIAPHFAPDVRPHKTFVDTFTPRTIRHFTGHRNGAVYGAPHKRPTGETHLDGLYICGTDQGFLGIVGAMLSGIAIANRHALNPSTTP